MPYTTPHTWVAGETWTSVLGNANVRDNVAFLANPPACRVYNNANQSVADQTFTTVALNSERFDTDNMHDTVTNNSRITFNTAGIYVVTFCGQFAAAADYSLIAFAIRLSGGSNIAYQDLQNTVSAETAGLTITTIYKFAVADYVEARVYQDNSPNAARNLLVTGNNSPEFSAVWVGLG
jgi:hypothetical protein